jgi:hypothetical protein
MARVPNRQLLVRKYCWTIPDHVVCYDLNPGAALVTGSMVGGPRSGEGV